MAASQSLFLRMLHNMAMGRQAERKLGDGQWDSLAVAQEELSA